MDMRRKKILYVLAHSLAHTYAKQMRFYLAEEFLFLLFFTTNVKSHCEWTREDVA